jgi:hypothetical protein
MICPLITVSNDYYLPCREKNCAWYNLEKEECAIMTIARATEQGGRRQ